ncbi:hypothetical protein U6A24_22170 [Aquimarina gracilis]|uniref:GDSL-like lipase/acylhydrolase family protein n=1 Tax=Aquimarina gracilis TaxID=874422 RepID=A0ABU6A2B9_9FLAO|nr:hypothetical protein [Aquimarina gracilis]MEB3348200.1 hypothetical protein [Aquimarina gracilis]
MIKREFKLSLVKIGKFIVVFLIADFLLGTMSKQLFFNQETGKYARSTHAIKKSEDNVLIFGSSHAHRHYVPEVFEKELNKTCYNVGAEGQQLLYHLALQQMIFKRIKPKLIILNIDEGFLYSSKEAYDRLGDLHPYYEEYKDELRPILGLQSKLIDFKLFFKSYQTNSTIVHALRYHLSPQIDYKGYRPLFGKVALTNKSKMLKVNRREIDSNFVTALERFIDSAKKNDVDLVFVTSPKFDPIDNSENESFKKIMNIAVNENVTVMDFFNSKQFLNQNDLFHDPSHLNDDGAKLFSKAVANKIRNLK